MAIPESINSMSEKLVNVKSFKFTPKLKPRILKEMGPIWNVASRVANKELSWYWRPRFWIESGPSDLLIAPKAGGVRIGSESPFPATRLTTHLP